MGANIIPSDEPSIYGIFQTLSVLERNAIVRPNNPPAGIGGFLFDVDADASVDLVSDITDHFVERNLPVQDQWALTPERVTLRGFIAELTDGKPTIQKTNPTADALPDNAELAPVLAPQAEGAEAAAATAASEEAAGVTAQDSVYGYFEGYQAFNDSSVQRPPTDKQTKAFAYFYQLWKGRQICTVETPWGVFTNMAIESVRPMQDETTKYVTEFTVTFKKIRVVGTPEIEVGQLAGRAEIQAAPVTQNGNAGKEPQTPAEKASWLYKLAQLAGLR